MVFSTEICLLLDYLCPSEIRRVNQRIYVTRTKFYRRTSLEKYDTGCGTRYRRFAEK